MRRFLRHFQEIWFNLIHSCYTASVPLLLLNARLSEKSAARYARYPNLAKGGLDDLAAIAAQTENDAARLVALGAAKVSVMGNLKFDIEPPPATLELGKRLRGQFGANRKIFLAASTREGEEALLLDAIAQAGIPELLAVIVPRHPQRFDEVAALLAQRNIRFQRRSADQPVAADIRVVLGDSMGEMFAYYAACDLAFIGGSLLPFGGQNLIEACIVGKPVIIGPHTYNFAQAGQSAVECGAAVRVQDSASLAQTLRQMISEPERMAESGKAGRRFVSASLGATERALHLISLSIENTGH
ncbi:MAG: 3-deoxy-D-manno-octulosonic-acid transferase [Gallionellaceae bacterium]|nr:MAG: 3-deoxy-D-manno-octulosonic-acid transferase [Gallionellaceae bacterium]